MYHVRKTKTASKATAVQVVRYINRKLVVAAHIGSAHNPAELRGLWRMAEDWIEQSSKQTRLFPLLLESTGQNPTILEKYEFLGVRYSFLYEVLYKLLARFQFTALGNRLLNDLIIMRLVEPVSKLQSVGLLQEYFGISHRRQNFYESLPALLKLKNSVERLTVKVAMAEMNFDFSLVFYDVTTLYFESFEDDELRKPGFSKDNKSRQPQIVIGLIVAENGFPVAYEIFAGNKFEGHTLIPVILAFKAKHDIKMLTVVADAAMISLSNVQALKENALKYIVGARISNLSSKLIRELSERLQGKDGATVRVETPHGDMVCGFSAQRYAKDKREMEKQIKKAEGLLQKPSDMKRAKFVTLKNGASYELHTGLVEKTKLLLGLKGYYTNLDTKVSNQAIIDHYHNLWHVEQAFRVAKSDLDTRPIFHFKVDTIKVHILLCFMALAIAKYMEIKTGKSIRYVIKNLKQVTDARMVNTITKKEITVRTKIPQETLVLLKQLTLPY